MPKKGSDNKKGKAKTTVDDTEEKQAKVSSCLAGTTVPQTRRLEGERRPQSSQQHKCAAYSLRKTLKSCRSPGKDQGALCFDAVSNAHINSRDMQEGQAFNKVAQEYSEDKAKGAFKLVYINKATHGDILLFQWVEASGG